MAFKLGLGLTPAAAIDRLTANDPTLIVCDLSKSAVMQMKGAELMPKLAAALEKNTVCQELILVENNLTDQMMADLATALTKNTALVHLQLEGNKIGNDGATSLAKSLSSNRSLLVLNLFGQKAGTKFGDTTLHAFCDMFMSNVTLLKITWRLDSRQSFRINKLVVRNNDIHKRIKDGKEYEDLLPEGVLPLTNALIAQREAASHIVGGGGSTGRDSSRSLAQSVSGDAPRFSSASGIGASWSSRRSDGDDSTEGASPTNGGLSRVASAAAPVNPALDEALKELDAEYARKLAELKATYEQKRKDARAQHEAPAADIS